MNEVLQEDSTKSRLLAGTLGVIRERGLAATTSREIAAASGVNLAGITYHFGSKDKLVAEALLSAVREWLQPAIDAFATDADPANRLLNAIERLRRAYASAQDDLQAYFEAVALAERSDDLREGINALVTELRGFLADEIRDMQDSGYLQAWVEPEPMANLIIAAGDGVALHSVLDPGAIDTDALLNQVARLLLAART